MVEVPLTKLVAWYEINEAKTSTLALVQRVVQGNFPNLPLDRIQSLGDKWQDFEAKREELGDAEFELYLQCQATGYKKADREPRKFYVGYFVDDDSDSRHAQHREKLTYSGCHSVRSAIYRACFPVQCDALQDYFLRWMRWDETGAEPDWRAIQREHASDGHPYWVTLTFERGEAIEHGFIRTWDSGRKKMWSNKLYKVVFQHHHEYDRACLEALVFTVQQMTHQAEEFVVWPYPGEPDLTYQVGVQIFQRRHEFLNKALPLNINLGSQKEAYVG